MGEDDRQDDIEILNVRSEVTRRRSRLQALVDHTGATLASPMFFLGLFVSHGLWLLLNVRALPWPWAPWDPYPFSLLSLIATVEAPFIALLVLMRQQRDAHVAELREETQLQVSLRVEERTALLLRIADHLQRRLDVDGVDRQELESLEATIDPRTLLDGVRRHLTRLEGEDPTSP